MLTLIEMAQVVMNEIMLQSYSILEYVYFNVLSGILDGLKKC